MSDWRDDPTQHAFIECCCSHNPAPGHCWLCGHPEAEHIGLVAAGSGGSADHKCPADVCPVTLPFNKFACQRHLFSLPPELRGRISRLWRAQDLPAWLEAREEAVAMLAGSAPVGEGEG